MLIKINIPFKSVIKNQILMVKLIGENDISIQFFKTGEIVLVASYQNEFWDLLLDFEIKIEKNSKGYYCSLCETRKYHDSKNSLIYHHSLRPLSDWLVENIRLDKYLCFYELDGAPWAKILSYADLDKDKEKPHRKIWKPLFNP